MTVSIWEIKEWVREVRKGNSMWSIGQGGKWGKGGCIKSSATELVIGFGGANREVKICSDPICFHGWCGICVPWHCIVELGRQGLKHSNELGRIVRRARSVWSIGAARRGSGKEGKERESMRSTAEFGMRLGYFSLPTSLSGGLYCFQISYVTPCGRISPTVYIGLILWSFL